jgi:hypothetical protein
MRVILLIYTLYMFKKIIIGLLFIVFVLGAPVTYVEAQSMTLPQLVETLISLGSIAPDKAVQARSVALSFPNIDRLQMIEVFIAVGVIDSREAVKARQIASGLPTGTSYPTITSFVISPTQVIVGTNMSWSGSAVKGSADIKQYRAYVVGSSGGVWTPATNGSSVSFNTPAVSTLEKASSFNKGSATYTIRFEVEDVNGGRVWQDRTMVLVVPAPIRMSQPSSVNTRVSNLGSVFVSLEDVMKLINVVLK